MVWREVQCGTEAILGDAQVIVLNGHAHGSCHHMVQGQILSVKEGDREMATWKGGRGQNGLGQQQGSRPDWKDSRLGLVPEMPPLETLFRLRCRPPLSCNRFREE